MKAPELLTTVVPEGGLVPKMDYSGRLCPKGVPFTGWRYIYEKVSISCAEV